MLSDCLKCTKNTESKNTVVVKTKNRKIMLISKCLVCNSKNSKFIKEQEAKGLLSDLPILNSLFQKYQMKAIVNKLLLAGDNFMPEMHLTQYLHTVLVVKSLKIKKEQKNLKKQEIQDIFIKTNQIKVVFNIICLLEILKI